MRLIGAMLVVLVFGATRVPAQGNQCMYANRYFSSGSISCQDGRQYRCVAGAWQPSRLDCADTNADRDQPGLDVDPSRAAPGVRQPAAPAVPRD